MNVIYHVVLCSIKSKTDGASLLTGEGTSSKKRLKKRAVQDIRVTDDTSHESASVQAEAAAQTINSYRSCDDAVGQLIDDVISLDESTQHDGELMVEVKRLCVTYLSVTA